MTSLPLLEMTSMTEATQLLRERVKSAAVALTDMMRLVDLNDHGVLRRFGAAVEGNFLEWLRGTEAACVSETAKTIVARNIRTEVEEDHPGLLHDLLERRRSLPGEQDFRDVAEAVGAIRRQCVDRDAVSLLSTVSVLESTAYIFLPTVDRICNTDPGTSAFVERHLAVDVTHSEEIKIALLEEWPAHSQQRVSLDRGIDDAMRLFLAIFIR
jgi:hypothetical protein